MAEGLFDYDPTPLAVTFRHEAGGPKPGDGHAKQALRDGEVEEMVTRSAGCLIQPCQMLAQPAIGRRIVKVALQIAHAVGKPTPGAVVDLVDVELAIVGDEFLHCIGEALPTFLRAFGG